MKGPLKYVHKPQVVWAIQYAPHDNCAAIHVFLHWDNEPLDCEDELVEEEFQYEDQTAFPGDWFVKDESGDIFILGDEVFQRRYVLI